MKYLILFLFIFIFSCNHPAKQNCIHDFIKTEKDTIVEDNGRMPHSIYDTTRKEYFDTVGVLVCIKCYYKKYQIYHGKTITERVYFSRGYIAQ